MSRPILEENLADRVGPAPPLVCYGLEAEVRTGWGPIREADSLQEATWQVDSLRAAQVS